MAIKTVCQTPGAVFHTSIKSKQVSCIIDLPKSLKLDKEQAELLDANIHNAMELVLAPYFKEPKRKRIG
jgi:hypothetical protein